MRLTTTRSKYQKTYIKRQVGIQYPNQTNDQF